MKKFKENLCLKAMEYCEMYQNLRHSESIEKYYEFTNSYFSCYSESANDDEKPNNVIQNRHEQKMKGEAGICLARVPLIQDLSMPIKNTIKTNRFRIKSGMTKGLNSHLSGMTKNSGLLRFARNDVKNLSTYPLTKERIVQ